MNGLLANNLKSAHQTFMEEGLLFYPRLFEGEELERLRAACEYTLEQFLTDLDTNKPEQKNTIVMEHLYHPRWHRESKEHRKVLMETIADPRCIGPAEQVFRETSLLRGCILLFNPRFESQEGGWHRDIQFILKDEELVKANIKKYELIALHMQIALVDSEDLEYVPFSPGRYDSPEEYYYRCADEGKHSTELGMPNALRLPLRAGDAVIFNQKGLHRGRYHVDKPRRTFMLTYTPRSEPRYDSFCYQPWMRDADLSSLTPRARAYFEDFIGVYSDFWQQPRES